MMRTSTTLCGKHLPVFDLSPNSRCDPRGRSSDGGLSYGRRDSHFLFCEPTGIFTPAAATAAGLTIGFHWSGPLSRALADTAKDFAPNAFLRIAPDNSVTVIAKHLEMGQGSYTGLATIVAEELDADWAQIRVEFVLADASKYANLRFGTMQGTGGSSAMANSWMQLRKAGATARAMLVASAAAEWNVVPASLTVERGVVRHAPSCHCWSVRSRSNRTTRPHLPMPPGATKSYSCARWLTRREPTFDEPLRSRRPASRA